MGKYVSGMYLILLFTKVFKAVRYREVVRINKSCLEASTRFYRLFYEGEIEFLFTVIFEKYFLIFNVLTHLFICLNILIKIGYPLKSDQIGSKWIKKRLDHIGSDWIKLD